jgi:lysophospholipase L1-like esterase
MSKSLQELDPNFRAPVSENGLAWHYVSPLQTEGLGWPDESQPFCRLPDRAEGVVRDAVWELSRHSAGAAVHFYSNAESISARWTLRSEQLGMDHMPATGVSGLDLYARDGDVWRWCGVGRAFQSPTNEALLLQSVDTAGGEREYLLYLPLYNGTNDLQIGVPESTSLRIEKRASKPICFYGTSIVHGGCATRTGMAYPAIASRALDAPHINLGFSGNGKSETEVAELLAELEVSAYVLDPLPNMSPGEVRERIENFVHILRAAEPSTPIVIVGQLTYQYEWIKRPEGRVSSTKNEALSEVWARLQAAGVSDLYLIDGAALLGDDGEGTVDGVHPTDVGFQRMAKVLLPTLRPLLTAS